MKIKCLIVDDEPIAQEIIEGYIKPLEQFTLVGKCKDVLEASNLLHSYTIDLLFLDIEMPLLNGLSFLKNLKNPPNVIITTAHRNYALEGFELDAIDYLLKPISLERFIKAVNKVLTRNTTNIEHKPYIYLKVDMKMVQVFLDDILYIEGLSNYVRIFCQQGKNLISYQKLSHLEDVLPSQIFIRSHRSYIVSISKIASYTNTDINVGGVELPIGGNYKDILIDRLSKFQP